MTALAQGQLSPDLSARGNAEGLIALLGEREPFGSVQRDGGYHDKPRRLDRLQIVQHFAGEITLAIECAAHGRAYFVAWDIDERVEARIPILQRVLERRGLFDAIATNGSDPGRGKVLLFTEVLQRDAAASFAQEVLDEARREPAWGTEGLKKSESRPTHGRGGLLRIGGRNAGRGGPLERFWKIATGEVITLSQIEPTRLKLAPVTQSVEPPRSHPKWLRDWLEHGVTRPPDGSKGITRILRRVGLYAYNVGRGEEGYRAFCAQIAAQSPWMTAPSVSTKDARGALREDTLRNVWASLPHYAARPPMGGCSVALDTLSEKQKRVLRVLREAQKVRDLHPAGFALSYRELATHTGLDAKTVHRLAAQLVAMNLLVIVDRGTQGTRGDKTIWAWPEVASQSESRPLVRERKQKRALYEAKRREKIIPFPSERVLRASPSWEPPAQGFSEQLGLFPAGAGGEVRSDTWAMRGHYFGGYG
jgi:hypothetical protein